MASDHATITGYLAAQAREMSERELLALVTEAATRLGWFVYHTHDSRHSAAGFPDLVMARPAPMIGEPSTLLIVELKSATGWLKTEQVNWLHHFHSAGIEATVWRPAQWLDGTIVARLSMKEG